MQMEDLFPNEKKILISQEQYFRLNQMVGMFADGLNYYLGEAVGEPKIYFRVTYKKDLK
jgi:hypothetical protein